MRWLVLQVSPEVMLYILIIYYCGLVFMISPYYKYAMERCPGKVTVNLWCTLCIHIRVGYTYNMLMYLY